MMMNEEVNKKVSAIRFSVFSPSDIRKYSAVEITVPETYDEDGMPVQGGLMDNRLGVLEPGQKCATCGNFASSCPGHFGHIELAEPVLHVAFVNDIHKLLISTCRNCGRLLLPDEEIKSYQEQLSKKGAINIKERVAKEVLAKARKTKICPFCGTKKLDIEFTKPHMFHEIIEGGGALRLMSVAIRERLERITDSDYELLGYDPKAARPEWLVLQVLPVPPVVVRPSIILETGVRSEDDLTHKLVDILRVNQRVSESKDYGTPPLIVQDLVDLLQYHVTTYFDNEVSGVPQAHHRSGRPLRTLAQRLKGKEGRFRGNLSGKRVDFSSRTVISPDPNLDISEVGIPEEVARKLTISEKVTPWNIEFLRELVKRGPETYPGANYIIRPDGIKIRLEYAVNRDAMAQALDISYVVERHLLNGDTVLFNRQPSLHRMSIMAHRVRVLPYRTFRLHPAVCPPYNADFDGDEMNLHIPQTEEAQAEAATFMTVQDQIISPRYGGPIIGGIRDYITAAYLLTRDETYLTKEEFLNYAYIGGYHGEPPKPADDKNGLYTGKQVISLFLPKGFNFVGKSKWSRGAKDPDVIINNGELLHGVIDKATIGAEEPNSVLQRITKDYGSEEARHLLNSLLKIFKEYISRYGLSYGFNELQISPEVKADLKQIVVDAYKEVSMWIKKYEDGKLPLVKGVKMEDMLENYIMSELGRARDRAGKAVEKVLSETNAGIIMARSGARGSTLNLGQMMAMLGQQSVRGKRISKGYYKRALSHFKRGELSPKSSGFISNSFRDGLEPLEFFFHAMGGREGLVDTAVRTQQSGYLQRRLINAMEHLKVEYDLTVRDPEGGIIQFLYGEDGVDPSKSDHGRAVNIENLIEIERYNAHKDGKKASKDDIEKTVKRYSSKLNPKLVKELNAKLEESKLSVEAVNQIIKAVVSLYQKSIVEPGEAVGVIAAQSMGEPGTQMTLRTFHFAGVKERDVTLGLPRLIELMDARKEPSTPSMEIYLDEDHRSSKDKAADVTKRILFTKLDNIVVNSSLIPEEGTVVFALSPSKMEERGIEPDEVVDALTTGKRKVTYEKQGHLIKVNMGNSDLTTLQTFRKKGLSMRVGGIPGITSASIVQRGNEWIIQTTGSNLGKVLIFSGVDASRTTTNNLYEVQAVLGIEAVRNTLINEILNTLNEQGLEVDYRHIALIADMMTNRGSLTPLGRHGIVGLKASVLARAAFEITVPTLADAASKGISDKLKGVTENVIVGSTIPVGTGLVDIYM